MSSDGVESVFQDFLGDEPRAAEWRAMRNALRERLVALRAARQADAEPAQRRALDVRIAAMEKQMAALETEEAISQFVEDSLLVTLAKSMPEEDEEDQE